ncbi:c-type cytochrome [Ascidiaceihabitans sp.]|uniref:c-type cytochrome n=1 Tax=Ascidiaceihabitans sp. TaxID=1872644 RepID=UPI00329A5D57
MFRTFATLAVLSLAAPAFADGHSTGDAEAGEKAFKKCKACHMISDGDNVIYKGGKSGPNLYGVIGRQAGALEGYKYKDSIMAAGEAGLVWDEANLAEYVVDPKKFLQTYLDDKKAKSGMSFRLKKGGDDVAAYLKSVGPAMEEAEEETSSDS